jgi:hypothetical protein
MATNITQGRINQFLKALNEVGGNCSNKYLRDTLGWDQEFYWKAQSRLIAEGKIIAGRGRGGSVKLADADQKLPQSTEQMAENIVYNITKEKELYKPLKKTLQEKWIGKFGFNDFIIDLTHSQGSKDTGGTFTRPDITCAGTREYTYLRKTLEVITFEVKSSDAVSIIGVLEAAAHRESANRSYVIFPISMTSFESGKESDRIVELAQKFGIGIILAEKPDDVESWELYVDAIRHEPDPSKMDRFLMDLPSDAVKNKLSRWKA